MSNLILFSAIFLVVFLLFTKTLRSIASQMKIRRLLKHELRRNKAEIRQAKGNKQQLVDIYNRVYNATVFGKQKFRTMKKREQFEQKVNNELNRMTRNPFMKLFTFLMSFVKGAVVVTLLLASILFGAIVVDEYKASSLTLPTIDKNVKLNLNIDFEESATKLLNTFFDQGPNLPKYDYTTLETSSAEPIYTNRENPGAITNAEQLGQALAYHMSNFETEFTINYQGNMDNFNQTFNEAFDWLEKNEVYLSRIRRDASSKYYSGGSSIEIQVAMAYEIDAAQNAIVQGKVKQIVDAMPAGLTDVEKVKYVNDYLVMHTKYVLDSKESPYTPYSILMNGEGVCEGYALAALLMLEEIGMDVKYVTGEAVPGGLHAWNLVKVEGEWYHLDVTWNDPLPDQGKNVRYDYFLIPDEQISEDHNWTRSDFPKSAASSYL